MLQINEEYFIGEGLSQKCYVHPANDDLCIKFEKYSDNGPRFSQEIKYYKKISSKNTNKFDYPFYAQYKGCEQSNLGLGFVYDLIRDETTKKISLTLANYLEMNNSPYSDEVLMEHLIQLKKLMIKHKVIVRDLSAHNICCKKLKNGNLQLIVIDGVGHTDFLPLVDYFSFFAKKKIERIFKKKRFNDFTELRDYIKEVREMYPIKSL